MGFDVPSGKQTPQQSVILNKTEEGLPSTSDVANADDIKLQDITENAVRSTENLIKQLERNLQGFADARTCRSGQTTQEH